MLNAYAEAMAEMHYNSEADFMVSASNATPLKVESVSEPGNTETKEMNAFGSTPQETQVPSKNPADPVGMVQEEESHLFKKCEKPTVAILLKAPSGKYVGGYYVQQVSTGIVNNGRPVMIQRRYFFDQKTADGLINNPPAGIQRKATHLTSIIPHMLKTLLHYDKKQWNKDFIFSTILARVQKYHNPDDDYRGTNCIMRKSDIVGISVEILKRENDFMDLELYLNNPEIIGDCTVVTKAWWEDYGIKRSKQPVGCSEFDVDLSAYN